MNFRARQFNFEFPRPAIVMGILNITPDSFYDGGYYQSVSDILARAMQMVKEGAEIIDLGAESTRPGATELTADQEWERLQPVILELAKCISVPLSVDTRNPNVAQLALETGASIINDTKSRRPENDMLEIIARYKAGYIMMHSSNQVADKDLLSSIALFFELMMPRCKNMGIAKEQIVIDPGIGFGKTPEQNIRIIQNLNLYTDKEFPLLLGASRKSFMQGLPHGETPQSRLGGSIATACFAVENGANIIRAHDVKETIQAIRMIELLRKKTL